MKSKKEVKEYLEELKEQYDNWENRAGISEGLTYDVTEIDAEEAQIVEIQIETLEWVLK